MEKRTLGSTDLKVSAICLGTMTWGEQNSEEEAHEQLDYAFDQGVNFIDTAEMYPVPPKAETYTRTEEYIGRWEKIKTHRDQLVIATKIAGPGLGDYIRGGGQDFSRRHLEEACDASLKHLNIDTIDLYQLHWPERTTNYFGTLGIDEIPEDEKYTSFLERLEVLGDLQKKGKIRHFGISNETPWGMMRYLSLAEKEGLIKVQSIQNPYSLLNRTFEVGNAEISLREKVGLLAYSPLGFGVLSGKYLKGKRPENARLTLYDRFTRYTNPQAERATELYCALAEKAQITPAQLALAFVNQRSFVTSNIIGATRMDQLKENIASINIKLSQEIIEEINEIHRLIPNPSP